jgi:hypothetical protein
MKRIKKFAALILALLRELGDENAYRRHLAAHGRKHSRREWQEFSEKRLRWKFVHPKCC